jgi:type IV secretion system protein VirB10
MKGAEARDGAIPGDRGETLVRRGLSLQSRLSNFLAIALIGTLGIAGLTWYYAHTLAAQAQATRSSRAALTTHATGDSQIPSIGRIDPPPPPAAPPPPLADPLPPVAAEPLPAPVPPEALPLAPVQTAASVSQSKTSAELQQERRLSGAVFSLQSNSTSPPERRPAPTDSSAAARDQEAGGLGPLLKTSSESTNAQPSMLPAQRLLLAKGSFIDCTLETAIDSTLPGMTTCIMATDTFGVDGTVVLLERGTKLVGETRGQVQQGAARVFVLWTEARTPTGVVVPLASPGTDELGRSGLPGEVNRHFWERFGAAMLVSIIDGAVEGAVQSSRNGNGPLVVEPAASQGVMTEVLKGTINIPPTVVKRNGDRIQVLVAHDVDFRPVYELRSVAKSR